MTTKSFVKNYAMTKYTFDKDSDNFLIAKLIHGYMTGKRVLDLGCGPVVPITSLFYPEADEVVAVDMSTENLDFIKRHSGDLDQIKDRALRYKHRFLSKIDRNPKIKLVRGNVLKKLNVGKFDSAMQVGCFGCLRNTGEFQKAIDNVYHYLKKNGKFLMVNWLENKKRDSRFNKKQIKNRFEGTANCRENYVPCLKKAGFKLLEFHTTSKIGELSRKKGYKKIIWAVGKKS